MLFLRTLQQEDKLNNIFPSQKSSLTCG